MRTRPNRTMQSLDKANNYLRLHMTINAKIPNRSFSIRVKTAFQYADLVRPIGRGSRWGSVTSRIDGKFIKNILNNKYRCPRCRKMRKFFTLGNKAWKQTTDRKWNCHLCQIQVSAVVPVQTELPKP